MLRRLDQTIWRLVDGCLLLAILAMVLTIAVQVMSRVINYSTPWTEELSRFLFIWTAFLGMATGFRSADHPRVEFLVARLPLVLATPARLLTPICAVVFFGIAGRFGYLLMLQQVRFGEISPAMGIGMWAITLPIVLGSLLSILGSVTSALEGPKLPGLPVAGGNNIAALDTRR